MSVLDLDEAATQFDLRLECVQNRSGMELRATFAADLFEPATIQRLLGHWQRLLEGIIADPQGHISALHS